VAKVSEILWLLNDQRGCVLRPIQIVNVTPWITFPEAPSWVPFSYTQSPESLKEHLKTKRDILHLLLETEIYPSCSSTRGNLSEIVRVSSEKNGKIVRAALVYTKGNNYDIILKCIICLLIFLKMKYYLQVENYGKLLAWKMDSKLAMILETDVEHFTKLLIVTFMQSNFLINDHLTLLRIECKSLL